MQPMRTNLLQSLEWDRHLFHHICYKNYVKMTMSVSVKTMKTQRNFHHS